VKIQRSEIGGPSDRGHLGDAELVRMTAAGEIDASGLDPLRTLFRNPLLVDRLPLSAVRMALEGAGPLVKRPHDAVADGEVVLDEIELATTLGPYLPEVDLVGIGDLDEALTDFEFEKG
jgi:hypothetical protein